MHGCCQLPLFLGLTLQVWHSWNQQHKKWHKNLCKLAEAVKFRRCSNIKALQNAFQCTQMQCTSERNSHSQQHCTGFVLCLRAVTPKSSALSSWPVFWILNPRWIATALVYVNLNDCTLWNNNSMYRNTNQQPQYKIQYLSTSTSDHILHLVKVPACQKPELTPHFGYTFRTLLSCC